jgi:Protein of unknown function (DUF3176)
MISAVTGAAAAVLAVSNGSPVRGWQVRGVTIQPQVWLSVLATLMDSLVIYALIQGAAITFWKRSIYGTKVVDFHQSTDLFDPGWIASEHFILAITMTGDLLMSAGKLRNLHNYFESTGFVGALNGVIQGRFSTTAVGKPPYQPICLTVEPLFMSQFGISMYTGIPLCFARPSIAASNAHR